jgi:hypothetical protein
MERLPVPRRLLPPPSRERIEDRLTSPTLRPDWHTVPRVQQAPSPWRLPGRVWFALGILAGGGLWLLSRAAEPESVPFGPPVGTPWQYCQETPDGGVGSCGRWHHEPWPGRARR